MDLVEAEIRSVLQTVASDSNPFVILGVETGESLDAEYLKAAYKKKLLLLHPDRNGSRTGSAEALFHVTNAYVRLHISSDSAFSSSVALSLTRPLAASPCPLRLIPTEKTE
jgi:hypothetical protein